MTQSTAAAPAVARPVAIPRRRTFSAAALREAVTGRHRERPPFEGLPVTPDMPTEFGPHHRWPDGSFFYCC